ncbi:MAG: aspartate 1-decarboxylase [Fibrobacterales bacterium]
MQLTFLKSKIHRATVTDANLNYVGSVTIDKDLLEAANMHEHEQVHIVNINNGERFVTYTIEGERGSGVICLNGAAARLAQPDDLVIIIAYCSIDESEAVTHIPTVVQVDEKNQIIEP